MSAYEKARNIIAETLAYCNDMSPEATATACLDACLERRLVMTVLHASHEMFTRFHAHCRFVGKRTGRGYQDVYTKAIEYAMGFEEWPIQLVTKEVDVDGRKLTVDVVIPESTTKATNTQLLKAYEYVLAVATEERIVLPERNGKVIE